MKLRKSLNSLEEKKNYLKGKKLIYLEQKKPRLIIKIDFLLKRVRASM